MVGHEFTSYRPSVAGCHLGDGGYLPVMHDDSTLLPGFKCRSLGDSDAIDRNLRYLKLRMLGEKVADSDTKAITDLRTVFDLAANSAKANRARSGWRAVCVALLSSPSFHLY